MTGARLPAAADTRVGLVCHREASLLGAPSEQRRRQDHLQATRAQRLHREVYAARDQHCQDTQAPEPCHLSTGPQQPTRNLI